MMIVVFRENGMAGLHAAALACHGLHEVGFDPVLAVHVTSSATALQFGRFAGPFRKVGPDGEGLAELLAKVPLASRPVVAVVPDERARRSFATDALSIRPSSGAHRLFGGEVHWSLEGCGRDLGMATPMLGSREAAPLREGMFGPWARQATSLTAHLLAAAEVGAANMGPGTIGMLLDDQTRERAFVRRALLSLARLFERAPAAIETLPSSSRYPRARSRSGPVPRRHRLDAPSIAVAYGASS